MTIPVIDSLVGFTIPARHARGRLVRLGPVLDKVLGAHGYPPAIEKVLAEALTLTALLGSTLKHDDGQMTLQAQTEAGVIDLLVCDYRAGEVRGYLKFDAERLAEIPADPTLFALFGKGYLAITFDQATRADGVGGERYQGIVPLEGNSLGEAAESYFCQSEQIPSLVRIATSHGPEGCRAGGILIQHLPEGEEGRERLHVRLDHPEWEHVRLLGETIADSELTDPALALDDLVWRLFHEEEEVRLLAPVPIAKGCRCNAEHIAGVIGRFPEEERRAMADDDGFINVDCAFCARIFPMPLEQLAG